MKFTFDVIFVDHSNKAVYLERNFARRKISPFIKKADFVIELPAGTIESSRTEEGDTIAFIY
jgi:uncharacterized membrane protein (UPF0127 family)